MPASEITTALERHGAIAVLRLKDGRQLRAVVDALLRGGVRAIELTMTVPDAIEQIAEIAPTLPADAVLGAGTVLDVATAERARDAGASFIVSPWGLSIGGRNVSSMDFSFCSVSIILDVTGRALEKVFTQCRIICQTCGTSERFARFVFLVQQLQQMPACGPIGLIVDNTVGGNFLKCSESGGRVARLRKRNGSPDQ